MTDLARLGLVISSEQAELAEDRLNDMAAAADRAEHATDGLGVAARHAGGAVGTMNVALRQQQGVLATTRGSLGLTATEGLNLSRQFTDIGVTAAMGMNPLMIAIQQGPQILDTFQMAAQRTGTSVKAVMLQAGAAIWTAMAPLLPFIAAAAAAAAVIGGSLALATRALNQEAGDLTEGLGLTADQLENVQNKGVTMGDVVVGSLRYLQDVIWDQIGPTVTKIGDWFSETMDRATRFAVDGIKIIGGAFLGTYRGITAIWGDLPAVIGDLAISAANATIRAVEDMLNKARVGINVVIMAAKELAKVNPAFSLANGLSPISAVDLGEISNQNAGAARRAGVRLAQEIAGGMADFSVGFDREVGRLGDSVVSAAQRRITREAGEAGSTRNRATGGASGRSAGDREVMMRTENISLNQLNAVVQMLPPLQVLADELKLIDGLAQDAARGMAEAFGETGRAMGDLLTVMTGYQSRLAEINLAESEFRLSGAQADRERAMAQIQNYGDLTNAAKGFFKEGSDGYKVLHAAEQGYRLFQFAMAIQSMMLDTQQTTSAVGNSMTRGAAAAAEGAARIFAMLGPFAFPVVAGMVALLATFGLRGGGGSSRSSETVGLQGATATARDQAASTRASGQAFVQSLAQSVEVRITADRDGLNAYVEGTAARVSAPMAAQAAAGAYGATRSDAASAQRRSRQRFL
jgi:hypothetical protein